MLRGAGDRWRTTAEGPGCADGSEQPDPGQDTSKEKISELIKACSGSGCDRLTSTSKPFVLQRLASVSPSFEFLPFTGNIFPPMCVNVIKKYSNSKCKHSKETPII